MKIKKITRILSLTITFTLLAGCGKDKDIPQEYATEEEWEDEYEYEDESDDEESYEAEYEEYEEDDEPDEYDRLEEERDEVWEEYVSSRFQEARDELAAGKITYGDATMRFSMSIFSDLDDPDIPLYIAMHGGGAGDTPDVNDEQWVEMQTYYTEDLDEGLYIAVRGVRDTWDTHFNPESYPIYDRLIQDCILVFNVNPNRVYIEGFSAGGDGVYAIAPRMADRFAGANMSSGHPNNVSFLNMRNLPIQLQVGEYDDMYDRNTEAVRYDDILNEYAKEYGGFEHRTLVHYDCGHNFEDYSADPIPVMSSPQAWRDKKARSHTDVDSFPPDYMNKFTRDPYPETVVWDLSARAPERSVESFYYLSAPKEVTQGVICVNHKKGSNHFDISTKNDLNGDFCILLNEDMIDFDSPVEFSVDGKTVTVDVVPDEDILRETTEERGDLYYQFWAKVSYRDLLAE